VSIQQKVLTPFQHHEGDVEDADADPTGELSVDEGEEPPLKARLRRYMKPENPEDSYSLSPPRGNAVFYKV